MAPDRYWAGNGYPQPRGFAGRPNAAPETSRGPQFPKWRLLASNCSGSSVPGAAALLPQSRLPNWAYPSACPKLVITTRGLSKPPFGWLAQWPWPAWEHLTRLASPGVQYPKRAV